MKKLMITALLMIGMTSVAQQSPAPENGQRAKMEELTPEQRQQLHIKKLTLDLSLNASQQKEFAALLKDSQAKRDVAKAAHKAQREKGQKLSKDERFALRSKMLDEKIALKEKVRKILSDDQFAKWEKNQENQKKQYKRDTRPHKEHTDRKQ